MTQQKDAALAYDPKETITGFNYGFCKNLFEKTRQLELAGKIYSDEGGGGESVVLTSLGAACLNHLQKQLYGDDEGFAPGTRVDADEVYRLFSTAREFLAIMRSEP